MKKKAKYIIVAAVALLVLVGGICICSEFFCEDWTANIEQYLKPDSVWEYKNDEYDFEMELILPDTVDAIAENVIKYTYSDRSGEWTLLLKNTYKKVEAGYVFDNVFYSVWEGEIEANEEKVIINEITESKDFDTWIEKGMIPEKIYRGCCS